MNTLQLKHAQTVHLFASTIKKVKNRSTINESMEMFNFFMDGLNKHNPDLAEKIKPEIEGFISARSACDTNDHLTEEFLPDGTIPHNEQHFQEMWADQRETEEITKEFVEYMEAKRKPEPLPKTTYAPSQAATNKPGPAISNNNYQAPVTTQNTQEPPVKAAIRLIPNSKRF